MEPNMNFNTKYDPQKNYTFQADKTLVDASIFFEDPVLVQVPITPTGTLSHQVREHIYLHH